jgi:hypothetical protein
MADPLEQELAGRARALGAELEFHEQPGEWVEAAFMKDGTLIVAPVAGIVRERWKRCGWTWTSTHKSADRSRRPSPRMARL